MKTYSTYESVAKSNKKRWAKIGKKERSEMMKAVRQGKSTSFNK